ncbi:CobW family GTP-binding protein [Rhodalgimonas zhirmunskyi]|uniref:GTP-binding protein n=1 Tax=Rhodalgimonas zhirmunskyi TaxID=2964767 RepID=A0AAJ1X7V1_9RHOB|nr:GTP-binding protein [Rhodoalgimonas zhirmunskyi]MDQ2094942.1 GTP-binding protein [Rhodoalgimonas zhirmunskyi]
MTVPILLITGFLGAGKTSFINEMLRDAGGMRIAAIVNDFGSINIDAALLETASDDVIGLKNGCICCSLQGDLLRTLRQILRQGDPQLIVIEASGIADPQGIVTALMDPVLWQAATLDTILCIVDAEDLSTNPDRWQDPLWQAQIASADIIQLSKLPPKSASLAPLTARLAAMGKPAVFGQDGSTLAVRDLIGRGTHRRDPGQRSLIDSGRFTSLEWSCETPVSMPRFQRLIGALSGQLLRAKGFLTFREKPGEHLLFQLVGRRASLAPSERKQNGCQLVLIGEKSDFDPDAAEQRLNTELLTPSG